MKRTKRTAIAFFIIVMLISSLVACGGPVPQKEVQEVQEVQEVHLVLWAGPNMVTANEAKLSQDQWVITKMLKVFEQENPGVTVEVVLEPDQGAAHQTFKTAALAQNGPDVVNLWSGLYTVALKDVAYKLDGKVPQEDLNNLVGWENLREDFKPDGAIVAYPWGTLDAIGFGYSKKLIEAAGLDFEANPPRTTADFDAAMAKIKATNVIPISNDEGSWPAMLYLVADYWWQQLSGGDTIAKENNGEIKFVDDSGLKSALVYYHSLYTNGYINSDTLSSTDSAQRFLEGKAAMTVLGQSGVPQFNSLGDDLGVILPPDMPGANITGSQIGGAGQSLLIASYCKNPDVAVKLCSFLNSTGFYKEYVKVTPSIPIRKDLTFADTGMGSQAIYKKFYDMAQKSILYTDNLVDPDAMNELAKQAPLVLSGKVTPQQALEGMDVQIAAKKK